MGTFSIVVIFVLLFGIVVAVSWNAHIGLLKKILICLCLGGALGMGAYYTYHNQDRNKDFITLIRQAFFDGKTLDCDGFLVNKEEFVFISQTYMFVGKAQTPMSNIAVAIDKCKIAEQDPQGTQTIDGHILLEETQKDEFKEK